MNIIHAIRRALGLHPLRRADDYRSAADVMTAIRKDCYRRHGDAPQRLQHPPIDRAVSL
jgi:hypothetical protein